MTSGPTFRTIEEIGNVATQIALQLHAIGPVTTAPENREHDPMGTATVIAPHLAITCKHVIDDYMRRFRLSEAAAEANFLLSATMFMANGKDAFDLQVNKVALSPHTDVAFLLLGGLPEPLPFAAWQLPEVDLFAPPLGSRVHAIGYHSAFAEVDDEKRHIRIRRDVAIASGEVVDIHEVRRDEGFLNFPCFQTDAQFDGGMSGAPVFDENGRLCGIVSSNLPPSDPTESHVSYVASLWPMAATMIDFGRVGSTQPEPVLRLMTEGIIHTFRHEFVQVRPNALGGLDAKAIQGANRWIST